MQVIKFKEFELDCDRYELRRNGRAIKLEKMPMELLILLAAKKGHLVTRQEMIERLWGSEVFIDSEHGINTAIRKLRQALRDDSEKPRFVETVTGKGYRFIAEMIVDALPAAEILPTEIAARNGSALHGGPVSAGLLDAEAGLTEQNTALEAEHIGNHWIAQADKISPDGTPDSPQTKIANPAGEGTKRHQGWLLWGGAVVIAGLGALAWYLHRPLPPPRVSNYAPLTHDGRKKILIGADWSRLYLCLIEPPIIAQLTIAGGAISPIPLPMKNVDLVDVSPDGSNLLVAVDNEAVWSVGTTGTSPRFLTKEGLSAASWSPDGKWFAYSTQVGEVYRVRNDWTDAQKLDSPESDARKPASDLAWSPDGGTLRFTRNHKLWEISSHGSSHRQLLPDWNTSSYLCCGHWTPDGAFFLFLSGSTLLRSAPFATGEQLWAVDERRGLLRPRVSQPVQLTSGPTRWGAPIPSKDGKTIFTRGATVRGELVRYDSKSKEFHPLLGGISAEFLSFSKDGKSVAYVSYPEGILWRANRDGSNPVQLTDPPMYPRVTRWSPDGSRILFTDDLPNGRPATYVVSSAGGKAERLLPEEKGGVGDVTWAPDGRKVVFTSCECTDTTAVPGAIRIADLASHQTRTLPGSDGMWSPRWSPDGRFIAAMGTDGGLKVYDLKIGKWLAVPSYGLFDFPTFSHDSRWIYFVRRVGLPGDSGVFRVPVTGGQAEKIADIHGVPLTGWLGTWFGLDPTDAPLLLKDVGSEDIYALNLETR